MTNIAIMFVIFLALLLLGIPVLFCLGFASLIWLLVLNPGLPVTVASQNMMSSLLSFTLIAMPGFLFVGRMMNTTGVTDRLFRFAVAVVGRFRAGLAHANAVASMLFATMSGNAVADAGGLGLVEITMMKKAGYKEEFAAGLTAASSILGPVIPPSSLMVLIGSIAQLPIGHLFYGGIIPGTVLTLAMMGLVAYRAYFTADGKTWPRTKLPWREALKTVPGALPALFTFVIIMGSITAGICTPTEAAVLAIWWSIILGVCYKKLTWKGLWDTLTDTVRAAGVFLMIISVASFFAWIVTFEGFPQALSGILTAIAGDNHTIMLLVCAVILLIAGCFLDTSSAALLVTPIMMPAVMSLGVDPIHFSLILVVGLIVGAITPPFGLCLFVVSDVAEIPLRKVTREALTYLPAMVITLLLMIIFPQLVTWLPKVMLR